MEFLQRFYLETLELAVLCSVKFALPYSSSEQMHPLGPCVGTVLLFLCNHHLTSPKETALSIDLGQDAGIVHSFIKRMLYIVLICFPKSMAIIRKPSGYNDCHAIERVSKV